MFQLSTRLTSQCLQRSCISTSALAFKTKIKGSHKMRGLQRQFRINEGHAYEDILDHASVERRRTYFKFKWSDVYPGEKPFDPYLINLPVRAGGHKIKKEFAPFSEGNVVFWESPNFFHLTPPAIEKHCAALKPLCTDWPSDLPYCPVQVETVDFLLSGNDRYHPDARRVVMEVDFDSLKLTGRPREKMLELLAEKYDQDRNVIRLEADRCPTKTQNRQYLVYLFKVLYYEANRSEKWEEMRLQTHSEEKT